MTTGRRIAAAIVIFAAFCPLLAGLSLKFFPNSTLSRFIQGKPARLLHRDSVQWREMELPGSPYEIRAGSDGDVWVLTYRPDGLSRWSQGNWTHFPISHNSSGAFAVAGKQVWVASSDGIQHFDGLAWRKMPVTVRESMAIAAEGNEVWVMNTSGMLTHCAGDRCETHSVVDQVPDYAWRSNWSSRTRRLGSKSLIRAFGRLWFIHNVVWFSSDGMKWTQWLGPDNARVWPVGYSGGRIWMKTWDSLLAIGEDLQATEFSLDPLSATSVYDVHSGDGRVLMAAGRQGLLERTGGSWRSIPMDTTLHADNVWQVASLPDGGAFMVVTGQLGILSRVRP